MGRPGSKPGKSIAPTSDPVTAQHKFCYLCAGCYRDCTGYKVQRTERPDNPTGAIADGTPIQAAKRQPFRKTYSYGQIRQTFVPRLRRYARRALQADCGAAVRTGVPADGRRTLLYRLADRPARRKYPHRSRTGFRAGSRLRQGERSRRRNQPLPPDADDRHLPGRDRPGSAAAARPGKAFALHAGACRNDDPRTVPQGEKHGQALATLQAYRGQRYRLRERAAARLRAPGMDFRICAQQRFHARREGRRDADRPPRCGHREDDQRTGQAAHLPATGSARISTISSSRNPCPKRTWPRRCRSPTTSRATRKTTRCY